MEQITPGVYKTSSEVDGMQAHILMIGKGHAGMMAFGVLDHCGEISAECWMLNGRYLTHTPDQKSSLDLVERIGDLPGQPEPVPQADKRAELRERLLVAAITGAASGRNPGDTPQWTGEGLVMMVDAAIDALDRPAQDK